MQALYAYVQSDLSDAELGVRQLEKSIGEIHHLYLYELRIFWHFRHFMEERLELEPNKQWAATGRVRPTHPLFFRSPCLWTTSVYFNKSQFYSFNH